MEATQDETGFDTRLVRGDGISYVKVLWYGDDVGLELELQSERFLQLVEELRKAISLPWTQGFAPKVGPDASIVIGFGDAAGAHEHRPGNSVTEYEVFILGQTVLHDRVMNRTWQFDFGKNVLDWLAELDT